jgi:thiol-disulfide isomerase/thioredoxin
MKNIHVLNQQIYITTDEEIKEGDFFLYDETTIRYKTNGTEYHGGDLCHISGNRRYPVSESKKIILTTNPLLDGVQAIDDEFLEWFVKNPSCEEVEVGYGWIRLTETNNEGYWVSIPNNQFEMQQEELEEVECNNCGYLMSLTEDESIYVCYNSECTSCYEEYEEEPKQETLEEAAENYAVQYLIEDEQEIDSVNRKQSFKAGAKWQAERMYSEEEVIDLLVEMNSWPTTFEGKEDITEWLNQFKKK